jgi:anti-anti-sigma regulatory factor
MRHSRYGHDSHRFVSHEERFDDTAAVCNFFRRLRRGGAYELVIDLRRSIAISSDAFGAIMAGMRRIAARDRDALILANGDLKRLLELSGAARYARVEIAAQTHAA